MKRIVFFLYGLVAWFGFLGIFLYLIGFLGNLWVPKSVDGPSALPFAQAFAINVILLLLFGLQHSVMARPAFKRSWTRIVPEPIERSTYVHLSNIAMVLVLWLWQPLNTKIWDFHDSAIGTILWCVFGFGWLFVVLTSFLINHFDLFGVRQVWYHLLGRDIPPLRFREPGPYKWIRHPLYVGWLCAFWATPTMTLGHVLFAGALTAYILIAIQLEERNLAEVHSEYGDYKKKTGMLLPRVFG